MASVPLNPRNNSYDVHQHLRRLIMTGQFAPGAIISQAGVAREIGVSRTPVREAMRMLQNEGLLLAEPNNRARVTGFSAGELEATYFSRILLESAGFALALPAMNEAHIAAVADAYAQMETAETRADFNVWVLAHREFHRLLVAPAGREIETRILSLLEQSTRFQYMLNSTRQPNWWIQRGDEHARLLDACKRGDAAGGAGLMAAHLTQSALIILEDFARDGATRGASILLARDMVMGGCQPVVRLDDQQFTTFEPALDNPPQPSEKLNQCLKRKAN